MRAPDQLGRATRRRDGEAGDAGDLPMTWAGRAPLRGARRTLVLVAASFASGVLVDAGLAWRLRTAGDKLMHLSPIVDAAPQPVHDTTDAPVERPGEHGDEPSSGTTGAAANATAVAALRRQALEVPVQGIKRSE